MKDNIYERRARILDAAKSVVAEYGVGNTTLQSIADEAGISKGALYYYYKTKSGILYDIMDYETARAKSLAGKSREKSLSKAEITQATQDIIQMTASDTPKSRLFVHLLYEAILGDEELTSKFHQKYEQWITNIEELLITINNVPKTENTKLIAVLIEAAIDGFIFKNILGIQKEDNIKVLEFIGELDLKKMRTLFHP